MNSAAHIRKQIETRLTARIPAALSPRRRLEAQRASCGIAALDKLLLGGLPVGKLSEFTGAESSGRTTAALAFIAGVTRAEQVAAWIDVADTLDPETVGANGVDLERLLWVRCGPSVAVTRNVRVMELAVAGGASHIPVQGGGSPHPRSEARGMPQAVSAMLQSHGGLYDNQLRREKKAVGTPGAPNRFFTFRAEDREEKVSSDRLPKRRGESDISPRGVEPVSQNGWSSETQQQVKLRIPAKRTWDALDQALRSADLLLQNGGFRIIVLDFGSIPADVTWRIPLATWFRFRAACDRTQSSLLLLTQHPCARSAAEVVVHLTGGQMLACNRVMSSIAYRAETERQRFQPIDNVVSMRKPPQSERGQCANWNSRTVWAVER